MHTKKRKPTTANTSSVAIDSFDVNYLDELDLQRNTIDRMMQSFVRALQPMVDANERARDKWWDDMKVKYGFNLAIGDRLELNRDTMTLRVLKPSDKAGEN